LPNHWPQGRHTHLRTWLNLVALIFGASLACLGQHPPRLEEFLRSQMQLSTSQIADIQKGKAVAKILSSSNPSDIFVFGAVYIHAKPVAYLSLMRDIERLNKLNGYLGAGEFSKTPAIRDMDGLSLDKDDIKDLRKCRPGNCELQLPEESMESARNAIEWDSPNVALQVEELAKRRIIKLLESYQQKGDRALGTYRDKRDPLPVAEHFQSVLSRIEFFPQYLPDLNRYLLNYPQFKPAGTQDFFYWEKVNFGLKPTIRVNHAVAYHPPGDGQRVYILAIKQLYASHYFQTAIDLSFCVQGSGESEENGFYLITVKASRQAGLTGFKGGLLRRVVVRKTRSSLASVLENIKKTLEHPDSDRQKPPL
jgi:hypothetical protein